MKCYNQTCKKGENMARLTNESYPVLTVSDIKKPVVFVIDMVNGFTEEGALADPAIARIASDIRSLINTLDCASVFVCDSHPPHTREFEAYPPHCVIGTAEAEIASSLADLAAVVLKKNSTNAFVAPDFQAWLADHESTYSDWIITGCCTDLCVLQFALSLQAWLNEHNRTDQRIIVPADCVDTYDMANVHAAPFWNEVALANMAANGITIVKTITQ